MNGQNNITKVLIAHIIEDRGAAENLQRHLLDFGGDRLECFLWCEENRQNSLEDLENKIHETDLLLLLVASGIVDNEDWGWLQWATVMSRFMSNGHVHRILLHNRTLTPLRPITVAFQHFFRSGPGEIEEFLRYFFGSGDFTQDGQGLNRRILENTQELNNLAGIINSLFPTTLSITNQYTFSKAIALIAENPNILTRENLLREIRIQSETAGSLEIFGLVDDPWGNTNRRLGDLVNNLPPDNSQTWLEELARSVYLAHDGRSPQVVQSTFWSPYNNKLFRPILYRRESLSDGSERFIVLFEEHISRGWVDNAPNLPLATLLTASILGARLQWEVCDKYLPQLDSWQQEGTEAIRRNLLKVKESFENIEKDAELRRKGEAPTGVNNEVRLRDSFDSEDRDRISINMSNQSRHKQTLLRLDRQGDIDEVRVALTELMRLNSTVMTMVATRYSQLLNERYSQLLNENSA